MCTPTDIVRGVVDVVRLGFAIKDSVETRKEANYQTEITIREAKQKEQDAAYERQEGVEEARKERLNSILKMGEEKADIASGNISLFSSTAINIADDEKLNGELNALTTMKNAEKRAENYTQQAQHYYQNAALTSFKAKNNFVNSILDSSLSVFKKKDR